MNLKIVNFYPEFSGNILSKEIRRGLEHQIERVFPVDFRFKIKDMFVEKLSFISPFYLNIRDQEVFLEVLSDVIEAYYEDKEILVITKTDLDPEDIGLRIKRLEDTDEIKEDILILMPDVRVTDIKNKVSERKELQVISLETDPIFSTMNESDSFLTGDLYFEDMTFEEFYLTERFLKEAVFVSRADIYEFSRKYKDGKLDIYLLREIKETLGRFSMNFYYEIEGAKEWSIDEEGTIIFNGEVGLDKEEDPAEHTLSILGLLFDIYRNLTREEKLKIPEEKMLFYLTLSLYLKDSEDDLTFETRNGHFIKAFLENLKTLREGKEEERKENLLKFLRRRIITPELDQIYEALFENEEVLDRLRNEESPDEFAFIFNNEVILPHSSEFIHILGAPKRLRKLTELLFEHREELIDGSREDGEGQGDS